MTPDRMRGWLKKIPAGAQHIQLAVEVSGAGLVPIATWEREEAKGLQEQPADRDLAMAIIAQAQEYVDAERLAGKFAIRWLNSRDAALKTTTHHTSPTPDADDPPAPIVAGVTDATIIRDLLKSHEAKDKQVLGAIDTLTNAYGQVIGMLTTQLTESYNVLAETKKRQRLTAEVAAQPIELTPEQREEVLNRSEAWKVFTSKLPDVIELAIAAAASKLLPHADPTPGPSVRAVPDIED